MIYRIATLLVCLLASGCWGERFESDGGLFTEPANTPSNSATDGSGGGSTTDGSGGGSATTGSGGGSATDGSGGGSATTGSGGGSATTGSGGGSTTDGSGGRGGATACAPPTEIPEMFTWQDSSLQVPYCGTTAYLECAEPPCAELSFQTAVDADGLLLRVSYIPSAPQIVPMELACNGQESSTCYMEVSWPETTVYYVQLRETEFGYAVSQFYRYDQDPDAVPERLFRVTLTQEFEQPDFCSKYPSSPEVDLWDEYVRWIMTLQWECE